MRTSLSRFQERRKEKHISSRAIAEQANIPLRLEYLYEIGAPTTWETKEKIIAAFCQVTGESYTVSDFEPAGATLEQPTIPLPWLPKRVFFSNNERDRERKRAADS